MAKVKNNIPINQQIIQALLSLGPSTYKQLSKVTGRSPAYCSDVIRHSLKNKQFGLYVLNTLPSESGTGSATNVIAIDIDEYNTYIKSVNPRAKNAPRIGPQKVGVMPPRVAPRTPNVKIPNTLHKTLWQPSSPYYKETRI